MEEVSLEWRQTIQDALGSVKASEKTHKSFPLSHFEREEPLELHTAFKLFTNCALILGIDILGIYQMKIHYVGKRFCSNPLGKL